MLNSEARMISVLPRSATPSLTWSMRQKRGAGDFGASFRPRQPGVQVYGKQEPVE